MSVCGHKKKLTSDAFPGHSPLWGLFVYYYVFHLPSRGFADIGHITAGVLKEVLGIHTSSFMGVADVSRAVLSPQHPLLVSSCPIPFESFFWTAAAKNAKMVVYIAL